MWKFRSSSLRSAAVLLTPAQPRVRLSTGPQQEHTTFYEFRTYCIRPDQNAAFLKLTAEKIHLRTAHSELIGYWSVEYGGLNKVFHIWKYDSFSQRAAVRAALAQDPSWISEYISKAIPMLTSQDNEVTYLVPWSHLQRPPQEGDASRRSGSLGQSLPGCRRHPRCTGVRQAGGSFQQRVRPAEQSSRPLVVRERRPAS
ncbi:protein NipSnap homolog 3A isoform X2 [Siniperca chuatsi]|uniref:protein NipSnap homolog 3A isoform X2 n=1 Tax=Siniperca chuatsi TaxID=119488 RepID=UPI001CE054AD|nr:protein NipSnap homolog 3A isoform X2 [Siniperca chuatsi]